MSAQVLQDSSIPIHGGRSLDTHASSILFPLYQTSTFVNDAVGVDRGFSYSRVSNPTGDALEKALGALEDTPPAVCFRTGMAAVYYPGIAEYPGYELQISQARGSGAVLSFTTGSAEVSKAIAEHAKLFRITVSFGSINSSISLPGHMSHASVPPEVLAQRDLPQDLVRISVGIEDEEDLIADLEQAIHLATGRTCLAIK